MRQFWCNFSVCDRYFLLFSPSIWSFSFFLLCHLNHRMGKPCYCHWTVYEVNPFFIFSTLFSTFLLKYETFLRVQLCVYVCCPESRPLWLHAQPQCVMRMCTTCVWVHNVWHARAERWHQMRERRKNSVEVVTTTRAWNVNVQAVKATVAGSKSSNNNNATFYIRPILMPPNQS